MKRTGFKWKPRKPLKRTAFKRKPVVKKARVKKLKRDLMPNRVKRAKKELKELSHLHVRRRDSFKGALTLKGPCITCGLVCEGGNYQAGHWEPDSTGGALLRYHPRNMHGQGGYCCNINRHGQQRVANTYTLAMIEKYGLEYVNLLRALKQRSIQADIIFYEKMLELYRAGDEDAICAFLDNYSGVV